MFSQQDSTAFFESILFETFGKDLVVSSFDFISGGCINTAVKLNTDDGIFFLKWNTQDLGDMFETEAKGLEVLQQAHEIAVPFCINVGKTNQKSYLLLEYIPSALPKKDFWEDFGVSLAHLHQHTQDKFGLHFNNYIGSLPQSNEFLDDGIDFFIEKRLKVQAGLAFYTQQINQNLLDKFAQLYIQLPHLIPTEKPALLHGDLWSGNFLINQLGKATLIDPAIYYGLREAELAFTQLFGGFDARFYAAYQEVYPLEKGFDTRVELYNLYPLLVHVNLFGSGYLSGIERVLRKYVG